MIFINLQYIVSKMLRLRGSARTPLGGGGLQLPQTPSGKRWVTPLQRVPQKCGPRAPRPHDPPLGLYDLGVGWGGGGGGWDLVWVYLVLGDPRG